MIMEPQMNVENALDPAGVELPNSNSTTPGPSPRRMRRGNRITALQRFVYHERCKALPLTTSRLFLMTTEWTAVTIELATPKKIPRSETGVPSRKTPIKNPNVTTEHARRTMEEGRECKNTYEVPTVKGNTIPRATW